MFYQIRFYDVSNQDPIPSEGPELLLRLLLRQKSLQAPD